MLHQGREDFTAKLTPHEVGIVTKVSTGIANVAKLLSMHFFHPNDFSKTEGEFQEKNSDAE